MSTTDMTTEQLRDHLRQLIEAPQPTAPHEQRQRNQALAAAGLLRHLRETGALPDQHHPSRRPPS